MTSSTASRPSTEEPLAGDSPPNRDDTMAGDSPPNRDDTMAGEDAMAEEHPPSLEQSPQGSQVATATGTVPVRLLSRRHLPFAAGAVALVTLGAFENRAVTTVLPSVAAHLHGLALFGAASAASAITYVISLAVAGTWADHRGPVVVLRTGLASFIVGQVLAGLAPTMIVFIVARMASGVAEGLMDVGLIVLMARALPESLRAKVFATFAAAWILPSLLGPAIAGLVAEHLGWRVVFLMAMALTLPAWALLQPSIRSVARTPFPGTPWTRPERRRASASVAVATGLAALSASGPALADAGAERAAGAGLLMAGVLLVTTGLRSTLPTGTMTLVAGLPAVAGMRALVAAAFGTAGAYFPLMLTTLHGFRPSTAGASLMVTGTFWAVGSWFHGLDAVQARAGAALRLRTGFGLIATGLLGPTLLSVSAVPVAAGLALWALAAIGMGLVSPTLSTQMLALSSPADQGRNTAVVALSGSVGLSAGVALAGLGVAWQAPALPGWLFAVISGAGAVLALTGAIAAPRAAPTVRATAGRPQRPAPDV